MSSEHVADLVLAAGDVGVRVLLVRRCGEGELESRAGAVDAVDVRAEQDLHLLGQPVAHRVGQRRETALEGVVMGILREVGQDLERVARVDGAFERPGKPDGVGQHLHAFLRVPHVAEQPPHLPVADRATPPLEGVAELGPELGRLLFGRLLSVRREDGLVDARDDVAWAQATLGLVEVVDLTPDRIAPGRGPSRGERPAPQQEPIRVGAVDVAAHRERHDVAAQAECIIQLHEFGHAVVEAHAALFLPDHLPGAHLDDVGLKAASGPVEPLDDRDTPARILLYEAPGAVQARYPGADDDHVGLFPRRCVSEILGAQRRLLQLKTVYARTA